MIFIVIYGTIYDSLWKVSCFAQCALYIVCNANLSNNKCHYCYIAVSSCWSCHLAQTNHKSRLFGGCTTDWIRSVFVVFSLQVWGLTVRCTMLDHLSQDRVRVQISRSILHLLWPVISMLKMTRFVYKRCSELRNLFFFAFCIFGVSFNVAITTATEMDSVSINIIVLTCWFIIRRALTR